MTILVEPYHSIGIFVKKIYASDFDDIQITTTHGIWFIELI